MQVECTYVGTCILIKTQLYNYYNCLCLDKTVCVEDKIKVITILLVRLNSGNFLAGSQLSASDSQSTHDLNQ